MPVYSYEKLRLAAGAVANAIHAGAGAVIQGSLMEAELRDALGLKPGEFMPIPKEKSSSAGEPR